MPVFTLKGLYSTAQGCRAGRRRRSRAAPRVAGCAYVSQGGGCAATLGCGIQPLQGKERVAANLVAAPQVVVRVSPLRTPRNGAAYDTPPRPPPPNPIGAAMTPPRTGLA